MITVDAPEELRPLPAAVEVAAYRIALEAMTNVLRHAGAGRCRVRISLPSGDGALAIDVVDDGVGLPPVRRRGVGLDSMRERAEELGGTFIIEPAAGAGTRISAMLPLGMVAPLDEAA